MRTHARWIVAMALLAIGAPVLAAGPDRAEGCLQLAPWTGFFHRSPGAFAAGLPPVSSLRGQGQAGVLAGDPEQWILKNCSDTAPGSELFPGDSRRSAGPATTTVPDLSLPRELAAAPGESSRNLPERRAAWIGDETATEDTLRLFRVGWR